MHTHTQVCPCIHRLLNSAIVNYFVVHGFCSVTKFCPTLLPSGLQHTGLPCPSLSPRVCSNSCPFESVMPSNHLIFCCPRLLLPSIFPSIRVFSSELALCIRRPKNFSFSISPS